MKRALKNLPNTIIVICLLASISISQVATGGQYKLEEATIANGGGRSTGGAYNLQAVQGLYNAVGKMTGGNYSQQGGFNNAPQFAPTAAGLNISGQVVIGKRRGVKNVIVTLTGGMMTTPLITRTNPFGHFRFNNIQAGHYYILQVHHKKYSFEKNTISLMLLEDVNEIIFRVKR